MSFVASNSSVPSPVRAAGPGATPKTVPPLSDALQRLMALSERDREALRVLELIIRKDLPPLHA